MRYMLGVNGEPSLLVEVIVQTNIGFKFSVINGGWDGYFEYNDARFGDVLVEYTKTTVEGVEILTANQDRLRGDYQDVFENFDDESYIAPVVVFNPQEDEYDDDIAF